MNEREYRRNERLEQRNAKIRERFDALSGKRENGKKIYTNEYCISKVADEFYLSERTVEGIIFKKHHK